MSSALVPKLQGVAVARTAITAAAFAEPRDEASLVRAAEDLRVAELALASARESVDA